MTKQIISCLELGGRGGGQGVTANRYGFLFKVILELGGGDGCTALRINTELYTLKWQTLVPQ